MQPAALATVASVRAWFTASAHEEHVSAFPDEGGGCALAQRQPAQLSGRASSSSEEWLFGRYAVATGESLRARFDLMHHLIAKSVSHVVHRLEAERG